METVERKGRERDGESNDSEKTIASVRKMVGGICYGGERLRR